MDIVDRLFELIDSQYKEQKDFAVAIGVHPTRISEWRKRKSQSYQKRLPQIASVLGTTTEYLLTGEGPKEKNAPADVPNSDTEAQLIAAAYRRADERSRAIVRLTLGIDEKEH